MQRGWLQQERACGQPTRSALCRGEWLRSLCSRVAAAPRTSLNTVCQQTAATSSPGQSTATAADSSGARAIIQRTRRTRSSYLSDADGSRATQHLPAAAEAQNIAVHGAHSVSAHAATGIGTEGSGSAFNITVKGSSHPAAASCGGGRSDDNVLKPGAAAAALKQRRLAAAAAKQHEADSQTSSLSSSSSSTRIGSSSRPPHKVGQQLQRKQARLFQRSTQMQGLQDSQLKPALQQLLQQMQQAQQSAGPAAEVYRQIPDSDAYQLGRHQQVNSQQQQLTAVAQLTQLIQRVDHPRQLVHILVAGADSLNAIHITAAAEALLRFVKGVQHLHGDEQQVGIYKTKVNNKSIQCLDLQCAHRKRLIVSPSCLLRSNNI